MAAQGFIMTVSHPARTRAAAVSAIAAACRQHRPCDKEFCLRERGCAADGLAALCAGRVRVRGMSGRARSSAASGLPALGIEGWPRAA